MVAIEGIDAMITSGRLVPGQRLAESDLSEELGVAPGRVREALRILAGQGVVELEPYKSARVRRLAREEVFALFETITGLFCTGIVSLAFRFDQLEPARQAEFLEVSRQLSLTAESGTMDQLFAETLAQQQLVNHLCGNPQLSVILSTLHPTYYYKGILEIVPASMFRNSMMHAERIAVAVAAQDPAKALKLMFEACEPILKALSERQASTPAEVEA